MSNESIEKVSEITALERFSKDVMEIWAKRDSIRELFAPNLTDKEFKFFMGLGISMKANPFKREIWAVKYDKNKPASIFLGRDFHRKLAQNQQDYNGHMSDSVYSNDDFKVKNGVPEHEYSLKDRGDMLGAYAVAHKKGVDKPFYIFVRTEEYNKKQSTWNAMPDTMIKKVAEAQVLRMCWQDVFAGTYSQDEEGTIKYDAEKNEVIQKIKTQQAELVKDVEIVSEDFNNLNDATVKLKTRLEKCIVDKGGNPDQGMIIDALMEFSANKDGSIIDYEKMSPARAKYTLLRFEGDRFTKQLNGVMEAAKVPPYLKEITAFEDYEGIDSVDKFKSVDHLYMAKGHFKKDQEAGFFSKQKDLL